MNNLFQNPKNNYSDLENYIDLMKIYKFFIRNKKFIFFSSITFFILACIFSLTLKRTWEGTFQIVLNSPRSNNNSASGVSGIFNNTPFKNLLMESSSNSLKTEVEILKSPSVLMPVFEFVKKENQNLGKELPLTFLTWKKFNLDIGLKKGTSVLEISYRDKNKDLIMPVLSQISSTYQLYSGRSKKRTIELSQNYLKDQIEKYKLKASESLKIAQEFAIDEDLSILDIEPMGSFSSNSSIPLPDIINNNQVRTFNSNNQLLKNIDIESARVDAANSIRKLNLQISKIQSLSEDDEKLEFFTLGLPNEVSRGLPNELQKLDALLLEMESKYTDKDKTVLRLRKKRELLFKLLQKKAIGFLKTEKLKAETLLEASTRPKGVITKYKELIREAGRNEEALVGLEGQLLSIDLEKSKLEDPWELITNPTLNKSPVAPSRKNIGFFGLVGGFLIGAIFSYFKEKRSNKIFDESQIENIFKTKIIEKIGLKNNNFSKEMGLFLNDFIDSFSGEEIIFLTSDTSEKEINEFKKIISTKNKKYTFEDQIKNSFSNKPIIFVGYKDNLKKTDLENFYKKLEIFGLKISGIFFLY